MAKGPVPDWIQDMFKKIDSKDLKGAPAYFTDDCDSWFTHFHCKPDSEGFVILVWHLTVSSISTTTNSLCAGTGRNA
jgi:hypothetical protein